MFNICCDIKCRPESFHFCMEGKKKKTGQNSGECGVKPEYVGSYSHFMANCTNPLTVDNFDIRKAEYFPQCGDNIPNSVWSLN